MRPRLSLPIPWPNGHKAQVLKRFQGRTARPFRQTELQPGSKAVAEAVRGGSGAGGETAPVGEVPSLLPRVPPWVTQTPPFPERSTHSRCLPTGRAPTSPALSNFNEN